MLCGPRLISVKFIHGSGHWMQSLMDRHARAFAGDSTSSLANGGVWQRSLRLV